MIGALEWPSHGRAASVPPFFFAGSLWQGPQAFHGIRHQANRGREQMTEEISYFEATSFLAEIEAEYADIADPVQRTSALVQRLQRKWPGLAPKQAVAYVRLFSGMD